MSSIHELYSGGVRVVARRLAGFNVLIQDPGQPKPKLTVFVALDVRDSNPPDGNPALIRIEAAAYVAVQSRSTSSDRGRVPPG